MNLPCTSVAEKMHEKIANIKETQDELKKEVDSLVLEHLKQLQQTSKAPNIQGNLQTLTRKVTQLETTLEQVKTNVDYMLTDYLESLESIIGQLEEEQLYTKSNLKKKFRSAERETRQIGKRVSRIFRETLYGSCGVVDE